MERVKQGGGKECVLCVARHARSAQRGHILAAVIASISPVPFFCYWAEYVQREDPFFKVPLNGPWVSRLSFQSCISVEPYLTACVDEAALLPGLVSMGLLKYRIAIAGGNRFRVRNQIPLASVYEQEGCIVEQVQLNEDAVALRSWPLGLPLDEFTQYVSALCAAAGTRSEEIHAVVLSRSGRFFRVVSSTSQLQDLLDPRPSSDPSDLLEPTEYRARRARPHEIESLGIDRTNTLDLPPNGPAVPSNNRHRTRPRR